ncbi:hypothetical protein C2G38_2212885 [Gigaspora rosea]|uniref:Myb/SANT-like DNA-binding domain-containing protein n=1 Tax=Gigaspora rosea TaxID=44941 RepID=A0A397UCQ0_9GLOM|nr:hypothetical protein C2G38_2212885 [Gigaspora rosea]
MWEIEEIRFLIAERKSRNIEYHQMLKKNQFWLSVAECLNRRFNTFYTSNQCKGKFQQLVKEYNLMRLYRAGNEDQSTLLGQLFFKEFHSLFWLRPRKNDYKHELIYRAITTNDNHTFLNRILNHLPNHLPLMMQAWAN